MPRNNADFQNSVLVHRGLYNVTPENIDFTKLGRHWTHSESTATDFANRIDPLQDGFDTDFPHDSGVIVTARVPKSALLSRSNANDNAVMKQHEVMDPDSEDDQEKGYADWEKEATVREGTPVSVEKITHFDRTGGNGTEIKVKRSRRKGTT